MLQITRRDYERLFGQDDVAMGRLRNFCDGSRMRTARLDPSRALPMERSCSGSNSRSIRSPRHRRLWVSERFQNGFGFRAWRITLPRATMIPAYSASMLKTRT